VEANGRKRLCALSATKSRVNTQELESFYAQTPRTLFAEVPRSKTDFERKTI
jgi:hypothetical protein